MSLPQATDPFDRRDNMVDYRRLMAVQAGARELSDALNAQRVETEARERAEREALKAARAKRGPKAEQQALF